jgi:ankyrin repeat protein|tara:strand:- start:70 stop:207 length:138 start_codon:yes stop_codon:yes gene_type:complete
MVKHITNNEISEIEEEIKLLPADIEIFDLRNDDGLTLLHMACFKD